MNRRCDRAVDRKAGDMNSIPHIVALIPSQRLSLVGHIFLISATESSDLHAVCEDPVISDAGSSFCWEG